MRIDVQDIKTRHIYPQQYFNSMRTIKLSSIFGLLFFIFHSIVQLKVAAEISPTIPDFLYELTTYLFMLPLVIPALLGLFYFSKQPHKVDKWVIISYWVYTVLVIFGALFMYLYPATDALETGLPMVLLVIPLCVAVSAFLFYKISKKE